MPRNERDRLRRLIVEREHQLADASEDYSAAMNAATHPDERNRLMAEFAAARERHRREDVELGIRRSGMHVLVGQVMWARWLEIALEHTLAAQAEYLRIENGDTVRLVNELRESMIAISAAASTIEALYEDVQFLVPRRPRFETASERVADLLRHVFGIRDEDWETLDAELVRLFDARNGVVHAYSEMTDPQPHPAGVNTSREHAVLNGPESQWALELALRLLRCAESPPHPANRWVSRWASRRATYFQQVVSAVE